MVTKEHETLALRLFDMGAIKFGAFKLKLHDKNPDAPLSPIYVDLRILRSSPTDMDLAVAAYKGQIEGLVFDVLADIPTAATPIVAILSHEMRIPMISPRKEEKGHGIKRPIDGVFQSGQVALLVDDLITLADSKLEAISVLEDNGLVVHDVVVLLDREQGGTEELRKRGYGCHAVLRLSDLLGLYLDTSRIQREVYDRTIAYQNPSRR